MSMKCDNCGGTDYTDENPMLYMCTPRPSDPTEIVSTLAGHAKCFKATETETFTGDGWVTREKAWDYIESAAAMRNGHLFLTI